MKKIIGIVLILGFVFLSKGLFAAVLVEGSVDSLVPLTYTSCFNNNPAIFFSEQVGERGLDLIGKIDNIIITESIQGLVLDFIREKYELSFNRDSKSVFKVSTDGSYEIWLRNSWQEFCAVTIDDEDYSELPGESRKRWTKLGETYLKAGKHKVAKEDHDESVVVVPKEIMQQYVNLIGQTSLSYLFSGISETPNIERKHPQQFEILKKDRFLVKGVFAPNIFIPKKDYYYYYYLILSDTKKNCDKNFKTIKTESVNCEYEKNIKGNGLSAVVCFDGDEKEMELVKAKYFLRNEINLTEKPIVIFTYQIENADIQKVDMIFWVNSDERKNKEQPDYPLVVQVDNTQFAAECPVSFCINLKEKAEEVFNKPETEDIYLRKIDICLGKKDKIDCSGMLKGKYSFIINNIRLIENSPMQIQSKTETRPVVSGYYYNEESDEEKTLKSIQSLYEVPQDKEFVYKASVEPGINLKEHSIFNFIMSNLDQETSELNQETQESIEQYGIREYIITYHLDFSGDGMADEKILKTALRFGKSLEIFSPQYDEIIKMYPEKRNYFLVGVDVQIYNADEKEIWKYRPFTLKIQRLVRKPPHLIKDFPVIMIDKQVLNARVKKIEDSGDIYINFGKVELPKGIHKLKVLKDKDWHIKLIQIENE